MLKKGRKIKLLITTLLLVVSVGVALTWYFRGKIVRWVKDSISEAMHVDVDFSSLQVSILKDFPEVSVNFKDLSLTGQGEFKGITLFKTTDMHLGLDALSLWYDDRPIEVKKIYLNRPTIRLVALDSTNANYLFYPQDTGSDSTSGEIRMVELRDIEISDGQVLYENLLNHTRLQFKHFNHKGNGSWRGEELVYNTETSLDSLNIGQGNFSYLKNAQIDWEATLSFQPDSMRITMGKNKMRLNALVLELEGMAQSYQDKLRLDIGVKAPGNSFKELFSLLPSAYTSDYADVNTRGSFSLSGHIQGDYQYEEEAYPDFDMKLSVEEGYIKYPDFPQAIEQVSLRMQCVKKGPSLDQTVVYIPKLNFKIGEETLAVNARLTHPLTLLNASGKIRGGLDLGGLSKAYPIEGIKEMTGKIDMDISYRFNRPLTEKYLAGQVKSTMLRLEYDNLPKVEGQNINILFSPEKIFFQQAKIRLGHSDFQGNLEVIEPLHYFTQDQEVKLKLDGRMSVLDVNEWVGEETDSESTSEFPDPDLYHFIDRQLSVDVNLHIDQLLYPDYDIQNLQANGNYNRGRLKIEQLKLQFFKSPLRINGNLDNIPAWLWKNNTLKGRLTVFSERLDMDSYFAASSSEDPTTTTPLELPENLNLDVTINFPQLLYEKNAYKNINGDIRLSDRKMDLHKMQLNGLGGTMQLAGTLQTPAGEKPSFDMRYTTQSIQFTDMLSSIKSVQKLMPIFEYFKGAFHADLSLSGQLNEDMTPVMTKLNAKGFLQTIRTYIENYPPMRQLGEKMHLRALKEDNIPVQDVKTWFEIVDGKVHFKPFVMRYKNLEIQVEGTNTLDKNIDYSVVARIPTDILEKIPGHQTVQQGKDWLNTRIKKLGIDLNKKRHIQTRIHLKGKYNAPKVSIRIDKVEGEQSLKEEGQAALDNAKQKLIDTLQKAKDKAVEEAKRKAEEKIQTVKDSIKHQADKEISKAKQKAKEELKKKAGQYIDSTKIEDATKKAKEKAQEKAKEKAKDLLDKWNPFKKKKGK